MRAPLLVRADTGCRTGTGHVMRCLALAQAWRSGGGQAVFVSETVNEVSARLQAEGFEHVPPTAGSGTADDARATIRIAQKFGAAWVVVDGYQFDASFQETIKHAGLKLLFIDDYGHALAYCADYILNQNVQASESSYLHREPHTRLLLGTKYAMLRREFSARPVWRRQIADEGRKVLVTLGGSDPDNVTLQVIRALLSLSSPGLEAKVVVGGQNPHEDSLLEAASHPGVRIEFLQNTTNMPELMCWADIAVSGAGSTSWEICFLGLPAVLLVLADNQEGVARELGKLGVVSNLGRGQEVDFRRMAKTLSELLASQEQRRSMSEIGRKLVDGQGASRVVAALMG